MRIIKYFSYKDFALRIYDNAVTVYSSKEGTEGEGKKENE